MKANARLFFFLGSVGLFILLSTGCYTGPYRYYDDCQSMGPSYSRDCGRYSNYGYGGGYGYRNQGYYPYYRNNPYYYGNGGGGGNRHNPLHIPSGRFHNAGHPAKWKL
ncbi:hypothetical protein [Leptospira barantonii]|uniref:Lipoprotein n=1 Tax=Leptospira barantonii TaxID=2023184 RepID=A0ABX4NIR4_9LEPT|nr:hypothetical protein [Leptospira barantonii]PJZ56701.1 hypothetical protein CH367_14740 [Leptospira barantonii]